MTDSLLVLSRSDVRKLLTPAACRRAVAGILRDEALGKVPAAGVLGHHVPGGGFHIKAGSAGPWFVTKINGNFPGNPTRHGLPTIQGILALFDARRGTPVALMDSGEVTALRTAAATAVAADCLARRDTDVLAIVGCGLQARFQLDAVREVRNLVTVLAVDSHHGRAEMLCRSLAGIRAEPTGLAEALARASLVITCTSSTTAFIQPGMLRPGTFLAAVGADNPAKQEVAPAQMAASAVVVDSLDQCLAMGDLRHAVLAGEMEPGQVRGTLGQVLAGKKPGRLSEDEIIIFDSTGVALQDVAAATIVYELARKQGAGRKVLLLG